MGFSLETSIPVLTVFVQGLLSFFSPCVLPLIPLYVGYLAGGAAKTNDDGTVEYPRKKVFVNTLFFVVGVSFAFFLLGERIGVKGYIGAALMLASLVLVEVDVGALFKKSKKKEE